MHPPDAADTDVNLMNTFPAGMVEYHAIEAPKEAPLREGVLRWSVMGAMSRHIIVAKLVANCSLQEP